MRQCYWYIKISKNTPIEIDDDNDCDNLLLISCMWFCIAVCNSPSKPVNFELMLLMVLWWYWANTYVHSGSNSTASYTENVSNVISALFHVFVLGQSSYVLATSCPRRILNKTEPNLKCLRTVDGFGAIVSIHIFNFTPNAYTRANRNGYGTSQRQHL